MLELIGLTASRLLSLLEAQAVPVSVFSLDGFSSFALYSHSIGRGVAQSGSALALGARSPGFESRRPDLIYVYIIWSQRLKRYYVGSTEVVEKRLQEHNAGKSASTRAGRPWELIYTECFTTRSEAMLRERKIKARGIRRYLSDLGAARHASSG